jgi:hypothetical protein
LFRPLTVEFCRAAALALLDAKLVVAGGPYGPARDNAFFVDGSVGVIPTPLLMLPPLMIFTSCWTKREPVVAFE